MLKWIKRKHFHTEVVRGVLALLLQIDTGFERKLLRQYPGIKDAISSDFEGGRTAEQSALSIATIVTTHVIETESNAEMRQRILEQIETDVDGEIKEPFVVTFEWMVQMASGWETDGLLEEGGLDRAISEVVGVLAGLDQGERFERRMVTMISKLRARSA